MKRGGGARHGVRFFLLNLQRLVRWFCQRTERDPNDESWTLFFILFFLSRSTYQRNDKLSDNFESTGSVDLDREWDEWTLDWDLVISLRVIPFLNAL